MISYGRFRMYVDIYIGCVYIVMIVVVRSEVDRQRGAIAAM